MSLEGSGTFHTRMVRCAPLLPRRQYGVDICLFPVRSAEADDIYGEEEKFMIRNSTRVVATELMMIIHKVLARRRSKTCKYKSVCMKILPRPIFFCGRPARRPPPPPRRRMLIDEVPSMCSMNDKR